MQFAGPIIGMPFSLEGFAFFTEAIFLGVYLYGWDRISPRAHLAAGRDRRGERRGVGGVRRDGQRVDEHAGRGRDRRPGGSSASIRSPACSTRRVPAGAAHAARRVRRDRARRRGHPRAGCCCAAADSAFHRRALARRAAGRRAGRAPAAAVRRPERTRRRAAPAGRSSRRSRGSSRPSAARRCASAAGPTTDARRTRFALEIPGGLSLLAFRDPDAEVQGLDRRSRASDWPPVAPVHLGFQVMVGAGHARWRW